MNNIGIRSGIGVGVGALDYFLRQFSVQKGEIQPFKNMVDWVRTALVAASVALDYFGVGVPYVDYLYDNVLPLFTESIINAVLVMMGKTSSLLQGPQQIVYVPTQAPAAPGAPMLRMGR